MVMQAHEFLHSDVSLLEDQNKKKFKTKYDFFTKLHNGVLKLLQHSVYTYMYCTIVIVSLQICLSQCYECIDEIHCHTKSYFNINWLTKLFRKSNQIL